MSERKPTPDIFAAAPVDVLGDVLAPKPKGVWPKEIDYPIDRIIIGRRLRPLRQDYGDLRESMRRHGLLNRVVLLPDGTLVAGRHRVASAQDLGWVTIPAKIVEMDAVDAELAEIDENLSRIELTVLEQAEHLLRREELLEAKGVRAKAGDNQFADGGGETVSPPLATTATIADAMGISERSAQQRLQIARNLSQDVRDLVRTTELAESTTQLLELSRMTPTRQRAIIDILISDGAANVTDANQKLRDREFWESQRERMDALDENGRRNREHFAKMKAELAQGNGSGKMSYWSPEPSIGDAIDDQAAIVGSEASGSRQKGAELAKCSVCHRPLSDPSSAIAGVGPCCAAKRAAAVAGDGDSNTDEKETQDDDGKPLWQWTPEDWAAYEQRKRAEAVAVEPTPVVDQASIPVSQRDDYDSDEWYTPAKFIEAARAVMGTIDLDPASCDMAQEVVQADVYLTKSENGLAQMWLRANVWLNCPYSRSSDWVAKAIAEFDKGVFVKQVIILVNNATETAWFQSLLNRFPACMLSSRIQFWRHDHENVGARQGQAIFYLGPNEERFVEVFREFGPIVRKVA